ncbi:MAG TPA: glycosyltransferase [Pyrinomonadaceae bacterium]
MTGSNGKENAGVWQVLDVRAIWIKEFASALNRVVPVLGWIPSISNTGRLKRWEREEVLNDPALRVRHFPLQRGFARPPLAWLVREGSRLRGRLARHSSDTRTSPLICCSPHYAAVAEAWQGPVVYYVTDYFPAYWEDPRRIKALDLRMCRAADLVCPNSNRIALYLKNDAGCAEDKIEIVPNATRASNLLPEPALKPAALPEDVADLARPVAGVLGNLANNIDWILLQDVIKRTPWLSWAFIGPTEMPVLDPEQEQARAALLAHRGRVRFTGYKPYGSLRDYARSFDVAVLPYKKIEPTYSGSSTRFYEHLATCRPMLATRGFEELLHKEPLLRLVETAPEMVAALGALRDVGFNDGLEGLRWRESRQETWEARARAMTEALDGRRAYINDNRAVLSVSA